MFFLILHIVIFLNVKLTMIIGHGVFSLRIWKNNHKKRYKAQGWIYREVGGRGNRKRCAQKFNFSTPPPHISFSDWPMRCPFFPFFSSALKSMTTFTLIYVRKYGRRRGVGLVSALKELPVKTAAIRSFFRAQKDPPALLQWWTNCKKKSCDAVHRLPAAGAHPGVHERVLHDVHRGRPR